MKTRTDKSHQRGLTLVEILVALTIGTILLAGIIQILISTRDTYHNTDVTSRMQENARFAIEMLTRDLRMADFWGCANFSKMTNLLNNAGNNYVNFGNGGLAGRDNVGMNGSDTITVRGAFGEGHDLQPPFMVNTTDTIAIPANSGVQAGDFVLVGDCTRADVFQVSGFSTSGGLDRLSHLTGVGTPGNINPGGCTTTGNTHCLSKAYGNHARLYPAHEVVYSIAPGASGEPALFRTETGVGAREIADGIENMQILYGEDTNADKVADYYVPAGSVSNMGRVVSVRISLLVRSYLDNVTSQPQTYRFNGTQVVANDRRLRQVYTTTITLRNRLN